LVLILRDLRVSLSTIAKHYLVSRYAMQTASGLTKGGARAKSTLNERLSASEAFIGERRLFCNAAMIPDDVHLG
jgi:hypothetical protein